MPGVDIDIQLAVVQIVDITNVKSNRSNREFAWEPPGHVRSLFAVRKQRWWLSCGFLVAFDFVGKADAAPNVHGA